MNMPEPKLFNSLPDESNLRTGARVEPAQLSYENGEAPGGMSGFAPHRSATQTDSPSLSIATPFRAPHFLPSGAFPTVRWFGRDWAGRWSAGYHPPGWRKRRTASSRQSSGAAMTSIGMRIPLGRSLHHLSGGIGIIPGKT